MIYEGRSWFLRWWPKMMLAFAGWLFLAGWTRSIQWATFLGLAAYVHGKWIPWRFTIFDDGLLLTFAFGRRLFLPKAATTVRLEYVGAFALVGKRRRFGYPLADGFLYDPERGPRLRAALSLLGYDIA